MHQNFFECCLNKSTHPEVFLMKYKISIRRFVFKIAVLNDLGNFRKTSVPELIFNLVMSFQYALCRDCLGMYQKFSERYFQRTQLAGRF